MSQSLSSGGSYNSYTSIYRAAVIALFCISVFQFFIVFGSSAFASVKAVFSDSVSILSPYQVYSYFNKKLDKKCRIYF